MPLARNKVPFCLYMLKTACCIIAPDMDTFQTELLPQPASPLKVGEGLAGWVVSTAKRFWSRFAPGPALGAEHRRRADHRSAITVPMLVGEDVIGVMMVSSAPNFFS